MAWWRRYWFEEGGRLSIGMVRIAIAGAMMVVLSKLPRDWSVWVAGVSPDRYEPVGILVLFGGDVPSPELLAVVSALAWVSSAAMLVGFASRASSAVSLASVLILTSFRMSFFPGWTHGYNVVLLAGIAFLFARGGDALSLDRLLRRLASRRGLCAPPSEHPGDYQWSLRLVQLACALMFFNAAALKIAAGRTEPLAWALSDNLRHHFLVAFDLQQLDRTAAADWLIDSAPLYKGAAALNLVSQLAPMVAVLLARRPLVRLVCGGFFLLESVALGVVMDLWNPQFFPLAAVFVDWDWLAAKLRRRAPVAPASAGPARRRLRRLKEAYIAAFICLYAGIAFAYPQIDVRANLYPFSSFPLFSKVRAKKPYGEHQSYEVFSSRVELEASPRPRGLGEWLSRRHRWREWRSLGGRADVERRLRKAMESAGKSFRGVRISAARMTAVLLQAPPYPQQARFIEHEIAVIGEVRPDGEFRSLLGRVGRDRRGVYLEIDTSGLELQQVELAVQVDDSPEPRPLPYERDGRRFYVDPPDADARTYIALAIDGEGRQRRYFVAREGRLRW